MRLIDTHCHLNDAKFSPNLPDVIARATEAGVSDMIVVGYDFDSSRLAVDYAERYPGVRAVVGLHPHDAKDATPQIMQALVDLAAHERVVGVGETGLDFHYDMSPRDVQAAVFADFIHIAASIGKTLVVHSRDADVQTLKILEDNLAEGQPVVRHCMAGGPQILDEYLALGCYIGITGTVTYPRNTALREAVAAASSDRIVIETDCPYLSPQGHRGRRNEPAYLIRVAEKVAEVRGAETAEIAALTTVNARTLYNIE